MPALPVLSVEVWQMILRFSISIAGFLDPDAFEGDLMAHGFGNADRSRDDEATYWESERTRNTLQRVCRAWDAYLRRFEHRYVRMADVVHRRIDEKSIKNATRISFDRDRCTCQEVCYPSSPTSGRRGLGDILNAHFAFSQFCSKTVLGFHDLPVEIIDTDSMVGGSIWNGGVLRSLKQVKVVTTHGSISNNFTLPLFSQNPSLKHLRGAVRDHLQNLRFISRTLVTFSLSVSKEESYNTLTLDLPALRHLRIDFGARTNPSIFIENILVPFFGKVGGQLRSLHWDYQHQMPLEIWERCPHLEKLYPGMALPASAPVLHRVHTLLVRPEHMVQTLKLQWPNLRRLILYGRWSTIGDRRQISELFTLWAHKLQGGRVTFEDTEGIAVESVMKTTGLI